MAEQSPAPESIEAASFDKRVSSVLNIVEKPDFATDDQLQAEATINVSRWWNDPVITKDQQQALLRALAPKIRRTRESPNPEKCLKQILLLPRDEDIRRALMVDDLHRPEYTYQKDEIGYPTDGWIGDYLDYSRHNEVPLAFHFWSAIAVLGAALRSNVYVERGLHRIYMDHRIVLTGEKATGKSIAKDVAMDILYRLNDQIGTEDKDRPYIINILAEDTTMEALIKEMSEFQVWVKGKTPEGRDHNKLIKFDAAAILPQDELATFLGTDTFASGKRAPFLTTTATSQRYTKSTVKRGREDLDNLALSMLACSAPEWMRHTITSDIFRLGFMDRNLFIFREPVPRCYPDPVPIDPLRANMLASRLQRWTRMGMKQCSLPTPEATEWHTHWYETENAKFFSTEPREEATTSLHRTSNHLWRLATMLAVSLDEFPTLKAARFNEALAIFNKENRWFGRFLREVNQRDDVEYYDYIMARVSQAGGRIKRSDLTQLCKGKIGPADQTMRYVKTLVMGEQLFEFRHPKKGIYYCNAKWLEGGAWGREL